MQVYGIFSNPNIFGTPLIMTFSLLNVAIEVWAISLFSTLLEPSCVLFFSFTIVRASYVSLSFFYYFFSIAPYFSFWHMKILERKTHDKRLEYLFQVDGNMILRNS
jgi:hypothetical protein